MTVEEVEAEVARIRAIAGDDEAAHGAEDDLWENVLRSIASGETTQPAEIAAAALKTKTIEFARWCA
jgi:hypothetical protein